jgi:iron complex outermembrane recepter protein
MKNFRFAVLAGASFLAFSAPVFAQDATNNNDQPANKEEIVVTGTLIRGIAPAGTNVVSVNQQQVQESGATTVTNLLSKVPQFSSFNDLQSVNSSGSSISTNRPNLRNLNSQNVTGTTATLLLLNGHRVVGMGLNSTVPDADFVPPAL